MLVLFFVFVAASLGNFCNYCIALHNTCVQGQHILAAHLKKFMHTSHYVKHHDANVFSTYIKNSREFSESKSAEKEYVPPPDDQQSCSNERTEEESDNET